MIGKNMKTLFFLCLLLSAQTLYSQSIDLFDIDASNFPAMKAKFLAFDKDGNQVRPSALELSLKENGVMRTIINISCPPPVPPKTVSVAMSIDVSGSMNWSNLIDIPVELGKITASELCKSITMPPSEFALQTCNHRAMIIQDFTTQRSKILNGITPIRAVGGNDFVEHLLNTLTGLLHIAKTGKHKRVAVLYTDAWWYALSSSELQQCIQLCKEHAIEFYAVIYSRPEAQPNGIKKSLQALAVATGGILYDGITSEKAAKDIAIRIQKMAQGGEPCEIIWESAILCKAAEKNNVELVWQSQSAKTSYQSPQSTIAKLDFNPKSIKFTDPQVGVITNQKVIVTARNADFNITNITSNNGGFDITPKSFVVSKGQSVELTVSYVPADSGFNHCRFEIENTLCQTRLYASGGWKGKKPLIKTLKLMHPNGGEVFVAGSDTVITWEGVGPDEPVKLEYSTNNGTNWLTLSERATGLSYNWRVPRIASTQCLARVTADAKKTGDNEMVFIPAGTFEMGNRGAYSGLSSEKPVHTVTISRDFLMSKYEVTQKQYEEVMGTNPSSFKGETLPVERVSWNDAVEYCNKLSDMEGLEKCYSGGGYNIVCDWDANGYRLPTEAEWEYAAKSGTTTDFYNGSLTNQDCTPIDGNLDKIGWYCGNSGNITHAVGQKDPNAFGLYDMSGNVWEWCWDVYANYDNATVTDPKGPAMGSDRVNRGGGWNNFANYCRSAFRLYDYVYGSYNALGFRVVRRQ
jgi:formylglycine-generating enzyme required for sulfatase activity